MSGWRGGAGRGSGRRGGGDSVVGGRQSPAGGPASHVAAKSRAARPLGTAPGGMAAMVVVQPGRSTISPRRRQRSSCCADCAAAHSEPSLGFAAVAKFRAEM